ncbi:MAG: acyltransferase [Chitinophagaceae bacterium]|nr:acyltransferase [Chitinophagaceae bacterium]
MSTRYLSNLTPLRGIAAMLTVIFHVDIVLSLFQGALIDRNSSQLISRMYLMVDFFFVLSGFIMCHVYAKNFETSVNGQSFKKFTIARFARVYPLHLFSMLLTSFFLFLLYRWGVQVTPLLDTENSVYSVITNLLLLHSMNFHQWFTFTHASWSISVEWWMYMIFPFLVAPFMKLKKPGRLMIVALCIGGYFMIGYLLVPLTTVPDSLSFLRGDGNPPFSLNVSYQFGIFRCMFGFIIGMMVYLAWKDNWAKKLFSSGYTVLILLAGLFTCMHFAVLDVFTVLFFPFILLSAAYGNKNMNALLGTKPMQKLGDWSFSIYLIHQPFLYQATALMQDPRTTGIDLSGMTMLTSWLICIGFIIFLLFVSYLSYRFIELPARNYINRRWGKDKVQPISVLEVTN